MGYFKDLREHIAALDKAGLLIKIDEQINKDTELMPLVRWQFRGLSEEQRRAFMFTNVVDAKGRKYDIPVVVGTLAASRRIYGFGLQCQPEEIVERWNKAQSQPIPPKIVENAPVHEVVYTGASLLEKGGLGEFPVPISTPGYDCGPFTTASHWFTRDPEAGIINAQFYTTLVLTAVVTSQAAGAWLRFVLGRGWPLLSTNPTEVWYKPDAKVSGKLEEAKNVA